MDNVYKTNLYKITASIILSLRQVWMFYNNFAFTYARNVRINNQITWDKRVVYVECHVLNVEY